MLNPIRKPPWCRLVFLLFAVLILPTAVYATTRIKDSTIGAFSILNTTALRDVPEPITGVLIGGALLLLSYLLRRRRI
jgi:hypothetical protein